MNKNYIYIYINIYIITWKHTPFGVSPVTCFYVGTKKQWKWKTGAKSKELLSRGIDLHSYMSITYFVLLFYYMFLRKSLFKNRTFKRLYSVSQIKTSITA